MNTLASRFALLAFALGAISLAPAVSAQDNAPGDGSAQPSSQHAAPDPQKQAARLSKRLGLSDDQSSKISTILQNQQQQMSAVRGDSSLSQQDRHAKMRSIRQDSDTQINAVLTPAQQSQYAAMKQQMMQRMHKGGAAGGSDDSSH